MSPEARFVWEILALAATIVGIGASVAGDWKMVSAMAFILFYATQRAKAETPSGQEGREK